MTRSHPSPVRLPHGLVPPRVGWSLLLMLVLLDGVRGVVVAQSPAVHEVQPGDTLWAVAEQYGSSEDTLRALNPELGRSDVIRPGQRLVVPSRQAPEPRVYEIQADDTLSQIAHRHHVSLRALERANPGVSPDAIQVGQVLRIPRAATSPEPRPAGGRALAAQIATPGVRSRPWSAIVVHHSATSHGNAAQFEHYHRAVRGFPRRMAYHFVIGNGNGLGDGALEVGPRWAQQHPGAHVASNLRDDVTGAPVDNIAIGIVLVGNFEGAQPTRRQLETLDQLVESLRRRYRIDADRVFGHGEVPGAHTACPGRNVGMNRLRAAWR